MIPDHADFSAMLARWATELPDAPAIVFGDTRRTWAQLRERSVRRALQLGGKHPVAMVEDTECEVAANRETLEQVLLHLVQNAIDAAHGPAIGHGLEKWSPLINKA